MSFRPIALIIALAALLGAAPALAITGGTPDDDPAGPARYPNVGAVLERFEEDNPPYPYYANCSGTLIAAQLFLTAAHCGEAGEPVLVTFDPNLTNGVSGDDLYHGTFTPDPAYRQRQNDPHDIAVIRLDRA